MAATATAIPVVRVALVREARLKTYGDGDAYVRNPDDAARILAAYLEDRAQEHFAVLLLDHRHRVVGIVTVAIGTNNAAHVEPADVFAPALLAGVRKVIVAHNHPSGDPEPSREDIALTHTLVQAGRLLKVEVLDHIVVGHGRTVSLRERGVGGL